MQNSSPVPMAMDMSKTTMDMKGMSGMTGMSDMTGMTGMTDMDMGGMKMDMKMDPMYFHFGYQDHILFENWTAHTNAAVFGWCALFFFLALGYELLKYFRQLHLARASIAKVTTITENGIVNTNASQDSQTSSTDNRYERPLHTRERTQERQITMISGAHLIQTVLHMIQIFVSYILMLAFMLFNGWICIAVILGAGLGYFLVGSRKMTAYSAIDDDHCH